MSCDSATGPVNIQPTKNKCSLKCYFSFDYSQDSPINVINKKNYLSIKILDSSSPVVRFSSSKGSLTCNKNDIGGEYTVKEMRIYTPSLHEYNGGTSEGELIIYHNNITGGSDLIVCIPLTNGRGTQEASGVLETIISEMNSYGNRANEESGIQELRLNLNDFIPTSGFYTYSATLPYYPCNNCVTYIVYNLSEAGIFISLNTLKNLKKIIKKTFVNTHYITERLAYSYNKVGAVHKGNAGGDIWIDCSPTGDDGEVLIESRKTSYMSGASKHLLNAANYIQQAGFGHTIILALVIIVTFCVGRIMYKKMVGEKASIIPSGVTSKAKHDYKELTKINTGTSFIKEVGSFIKRGPSHLKWDKQPAAASGKLLNLLSKGNKS